MKFGDILRKLIEDRGITQKKLAACLNIAPSTLGNYIQNSREPDYETLKRIAEYFNVTVDYLIGYPDPNAHNRKEEELLYIFRSLSDEQQDLYLEQGKAFLKVNEKEKSSKSASQSGDMVG